MPIRIRCKGNFNKTDTFLRRCTNGIPTSLLEKYGQKGVAALRSATPVDTGLTASSWEYRIIATKTGARVDFINTNIQNDWAPIAILLQYGHATRNGGWVEGRDYINPAIQPLFDQLADDAWKEVVG